ncbi:MAG: ABC transporter ATP-binding protein [Fimbriimonadaceae bacterium]
MPVLEVDDLRVRIGSTPILRGVSLSLDAGQTLGVVGESGCGKSMTGFAVMGMLPAGGVLESGSIRLDGREISRLTPKQWREVRGSQIALVMQDPFTSLNPMMRVGHQIAEALLLHHPMSREQAWRQSVEMLDRVGVPSPETTARRYPHQLSGGQRQRVVLGIAFACRPKVLIADEPTTALDVTLQAQILRLIQELKDTHGTAVMLISHDVGVIGTLSSRVAVFYAGRVVEQGAAETVLRAPRHPYTRALLAALPRRGQTELPVIAGQPPNPASMPAGCPFAPRCPQRYEACDREPDLLDVGEGHRASCWRASEPAPSH